MTRVSGIKQGMQNKQLALLRSICTTLAMSVQYARLQYGNTNAIRQLDQSRPKPRPTKATWHIIEAMWSCQRVLLIKITFWGKSSLFFVFSLFRLIISLFQTNKSKFTCVISAYWIRGRPRVEKGIIRSMIFNFNFLNYEVFSIVWSADSACCCQDC